jgi:hypothetical protein
MSRDLPPGPKLFTVGEANALLPFLEKSLSDLNTLRAEINELRRDVDVLVLITDSTGSAENPDAAELHRKRRRLRVASAEADRLSRSIEDTGCLVKHLEEGLVDFFHLRDDRLVFLCWKTGEKIVRFWHPVARGFAGRQPLEPHHDPSRPDSAD